MANSLYAVTVAPQIFYLTESMSLTFTNEGNKKWNNHHSKPPNDNLTDVKIELYHHLKTKSPELFCTVEGSIVKGVYKPSSITNVTTSPHADDPVFKITAASTQNTANKTSGDTAIKSVDQPHARWRISVKVKISSSEKYSSKDKVNFRARDATPKGKLVKAYLVKPPNSDNIDSSLNRAVLYYKTMGIDVTTFSTLEELSSKIVKESDDSLAEVHVISHGNTIRFFARWSNSSTSNFVTSRMIEDEESPTIDANKSKLEKKLISDGKIIIIGCNVGTYSHFIDAFRDRLFNNGGDACYGPRYRVFYEQFNTQLVAEYFMESFYFWHHEWNEPQTNIDEGQKKDYKKKYKPSGKTDSQLDTQWNNDLPTFTKKRRNYLTKTYTHNDMSEKDFYDRTNKEVDQCTDDEIQTEMCNFMLETYVYNDLDNDPENFMIQRGLTQTERRTKLLQYWTYEGKYTRIKKETNTGAICLKNTVSGSTPEFFGFPTQAGIGSASDDIIKISGADQHHVIIDFQKKNDANAIGANGSKYQIGSGTIKTGDGKTKDKLTLPVDISLYDSSNKLLGKVHVRWTKNVDSWFIYKDKKGTEKKGSLSLCDERYRILRHNKYGPYNSSDHRQRPRLNVHFRKT